MDRSRLIALALILTPVALPGHTDINETIKALSGKIKETPSAELYYQRATEYRALRERDHTLEDLRSALTLDPDHYRARVALVIALGKSEEAMAMAHELLDRSKRATLASEAGYLIANIHNLRGHHPAALKVCEEARRNGKVLTTDFELLHAGVLLSLHRPAEAAGILKQAWKRTNSIVLRNNWIDTALTADLTGEVLPIIEEELASSRFRSSWLIRRARARLANKQTEAARADLRAALVEISPRINRERPDLTLIADRGLIHALMGDLDLASRDLETLRKSSLAPVSYRLLSGALAKD